MKRFGLIGRSLGHSFSASYFADKFSRERIDAEYLNFELPDIRELRSLIASHPDLCGLNVTIPYKQAVIPLLDELDDAAAVIGAVNTIIIRHHENRIWLRGCNTDAPGFLESVRDLLPSSQIKALILGTGGASLAVKYALESIGVGCTHVSRTPASSGTLSYEQIDEEVLCAHRLVVNCTPLGTHPHPEDCPPIPYRWITTDHMAHDLVYNPGCTEFMRRCAAQGASVRNVLKMLHTQAELAWNLWTQDNQERHGM